MKYYFAFGMVFNSLLLMAQDSLHVQKTDSVKTVSEQKGAKELSALDMIWADCNPSKNVALIFSDNTHVGAVDIGTKDIRANIIGDCKCTVVFKSMIREAQPTSLFIRYNDNGNDLFYSATIGCRDNAESPIDVRKKVLPQAINESRAITPEAEPLEKQLMMRRMGALEGKEKHKYDGIAEANDRVFFKFADVTQDENYKYVKLGLINKSKKDYVIKLVDFLYKSGKDYKQVYPDGSNVENDVKVVSGKSLDLVYALPIFNITSKWALFITVHEGSGSRNIELKVDFDVLDHADPAK